MINLRDQAYADQANFRSLWQDTSNWVLPLHGRIEESRTPGERLGVHINDITAILEVRNMASGLSAQIIPPGQEYFKLANADEDQDNDEINSYLDSLTEWAHTEQYNSNFIEEFNVALLSLIVFGNAAFYPYWTLRTGLTHRNYPIGSYQVMQNEDGVIDTFILSCKKTLHEVVSRYQDLGKGMASDLEALKAGRGEPFKQYEIVQLIRPRASRDANSMTNVNMPWESVHVCKEDRYVLEESGFPEFPIAVPRWSRSPGEVYGRGIGTEILPQVTKLNQMELDITFAGQQWAKPPLEVLDTFDGNVNLTPGAQNFVTQLNSIKGIEFGARGQYPYGKDILQDQRSIVQEAFFKSTFEQLSMLTGDRRTTAEIYGRMKEGFKKISQPIGRIFSELCSPVIQRSVRLLIDNGAVPSPPPSLRSAKIEYTGPLALALRDQHVEAFDIWFDFGARMEEVSPGALDNIDFDESIRDIGRFLGVKESHIRKIAERDAIRERRAEQLRQQQALEAAQVAAQGYAQTNQAPVPGSPAENLQGVL